ncbi:uncharacterized protein JCM6883_006288 [Sporobolomyces salmoneus]|uniref:uncharacterized protein n=1 Tax=Sporobolomyces salmoneus TaxID=183962 RepID=UPI003171D6BB
MAHPHAPTLGTPSGHSRSVSPASSSSSLKSSVHFGRWSREEEAELVSTVQSFSGDLKQLEYWEIIKSKLQTNAKGRSAKALRDRYKALMKSAQKNEVKKEELPVSELLVSSDHSQEGTFNHVSPALSGSSLSLPSASQESRRVSSPLAQSVPSSSQNHPQQAQFTVSFSNSPAPPPQWTLAEDAVLLTSLICPSEHIQTWSDVHAVAARTFELGERATFNKTIVECQERYYHALRGIRLGGRNDWAEETITTIERNNSTHRDQLSMHALGTELGPPPSSLQESTSRPISSPQATFSSLRQTLVPPLHPFLEHSSFQPAHTVDIKPLAQRPLVPFSNSNTQTVPSLFPPSTSQLGSSFTGSTEALRRNSITFDSAEGPSSNHPQRRPSSPGFLIDFPRVHEQRTVDDPKLASSAFGFHEHDPRIPPPQPSVLARPSLSPARSRPSLSRPKPIPSLMNVPQNQNPQRLLTPQDPTQLELFPAHSPPPPATIVPSAVSTSKPSILSHGQPYPHPFVVPSSLPLSPVSPELSRERQLPLPSSPVIDKDPSRSKENPLFLAPSSSLTSKSSDGGLEESHTTTGLGIELGEEGEVEQILERSRGESKEAVSGGTGEGEPGQEEGQSPPAKRRKVQFAERQKEQEK